MKKTVMKRSVMMALAFIFAATTAWATSGIWNGTMNGAWTNNANWSVVPYPLAPDSASFTNAGNGQTTIDVSDLASITYVTFNTPSVAAYTLGTGAANSQTLVLADNGIITLTETAGNSQVVNAGLQLGTTMTGSTYTLINSNVAQTLTFNNVFGALISGTAGAKTLNINGAGNTTILGSMHRGGSTSLALTDNSSGTVTLAGTNTFVSITQTTNGVLALTGSNLVTTLNMNGGSNSVVDIGSGFLALSNGGGTTLTSSQGGTINGSGTLWLSGTAGAFSDNSVAAGKTLVINCPITSPAGFEVYGNTGTFVFNATNTFPMDVTFNMAGAISVWNIGTRGSSTSNLGKGTNIIFNANATPGGKLIYTGTGEESDRILSINFNAIIDHSGTGLLKFTSPLTSSAWGKTLTLQGSTTGVGEIAGMIPVGYTTSNALVKTGTGTWILSSTNAFAGTTTVNGGTLVITGTNGTINASTGYTINAGGTLLLENASTANHANRLHDFSPITMNSATLCFTNNGGAVDYSESAGSITITSGNNTIATSGAIMGQKSTLSFKGLSIVSGKVNFTGAGLGDSDQNRIFINGLTNGLVGPWATVNGTSYAAYSGTRGIYAADVAVTTDIAAEGGVAESVIPNNGTLLARINLPGISGPIALQGITVSDSAQVLQNTTTNTTVATAGKLMRTAGLSIAEGKASLTIGENENDGSLSTLLAGGTLVLENNSASGALTVNAPVVNNTSASSLSKIGTGTVVLKGTNTYSGSTIISEGVLTFGGASAQTVTAAISGPGQLARSGTGTLNLNTANTYTGGTRIDSGTVTLGNIASLSTGGVTNNGILNITGGNNVAISGLAAALGGTGTNNVTLSTGVNATYLNGNYSDFTGVWNIGVNAAAGAGRATMDGLDNGAATINILSNATLWMTVPVTHYATAILNGGDTGESYGQLRLDACNWAGPVILASPMTSAGDAFLGSENVNATLSGVISEVNGPYEVGKLGKMILTLTGSNTFAGPVFVKAGAISVPVMGSIGGSGSPLGAQTSAVNGRVRLGNGATTTTLIYTGAGETSDRMIDLAGTTGGATLDQSGTGALAITGGMMISGTGAKALTLLGSTTGTGEFAGAITNGAGSTVAVTKTGTGTWTLSGANTYSGATTISNGTLAVTGSLTNTTVTMVGGILDVSGILNTGVTINGGTGTKAIIRNAAALGFGKVDFATGATTPRLELKIDGGGVIAMPSRIGGNSTMTDAIDVDNNGSGTGGVIQFNGSTCDFGNTVVNITGANGYSLYIDKLRNTGGGSGTMVLNPTTAALGIGTLSGQQSAGGPNAYNIQLDGTHSGNTITGAITDRSGTAITAVGITKANTSTWTLTGVSTYTNATTVNGGTLLVNAPGSLGAGSAVTVNNSGIFGGSGTINGTVTVNTGGRLAPGGIGNVSTFNLSSNVTLSGGSVLALDVSNTSTDLVAVAGVFTVNNANIVELGLSAESLAEGTYTLMTYASKSGSGTITLDRPYTNASLNVGATALTLTVGAGGTGSGLIWKGDVSSSWDGTDNNWRTNGVATVFAPGDLVNFDDTAANFSVSSGSAVLPGSVAFNNTSNYTVSAAIDGTTAFIKFGSGIASFTGLTTWNPSAITVNAGTFALGGASQLNSGNYTPAILNNGSMDYASSAVQTLGGVISGTGALTVSGSGTLALSGANTYSGATTVNSGILKIQHANALGGTGSGTTVASGGTLELAGTITTAGEALSLSGVLSSQTGSNIYAGIVTLQTGATLDVGAGAFLVLTASTPNIGAIPFTKTGAGMLRFTGDPNHRGDCTIAQGTVEMLLGSGSTDARYLINPGATLRNMGSNQNLGDYDIRADGTFDVQVTDQIGALLGSGLVTIGNTSAYTLSIGGGDRSGEFSGVIQNGSGTLSLTKNGAGVQTLSGNNTYSGTTTLNGGQLNINSSTAIGTGPFTIAGYTLDNTSGSAITLSSNNPQNWNNNFTFNGTKSLNLGTGAVTMSANRTVTVTTNTLTVGGVVVGAFTLTKAGAGTLTLSGANTYNGATTVSGGKLLINGSTVSASAFTVSSGATLGGAGSITGNVNVAAGGMLSPGADGAVGTLFMGGTLALNGNALYFDISNVATDKVAVVGALTLNGGNTVVLNLPTGSIPAGTYTLMTYGSMTGSGAFVLASAYPNVTLTATSTSLILTVGAGGSGNGLTWKGSVSTSWDGMDQNWDLSGVSTNFTLGDGVIFDDTATNYTVSSGAAVTPGNLVVNSANNYTINATLTGTAQLLKLGAGTAAFSGLSSYSPDAFNVLGGTLLLGGTSQLNGGLYATNMINNGTLIYGSSAVQTLSGLISGTGALTVSGSGTLTLTSSNTYSGAVTVNSGTLNIQNGFALGTTAAGTMVAAGGTLAIMGGIAIPAETLNLYGTFSSLTGSNVYAGAVTFQQGSVVNVNASSTNILTASTAGTGAITKTGGGLLKLTTDPNHTGVMTINEGTVEVAGGTTDGDYVINNGGAFAASVANAINDNNNVTVNNGGLYKLLQSDTIKALFGDGTVTKDTTGAATLTVGGNNGSGLFSGVIQNGSGAMSLTKTGSGIQTLTGVNTYTGVTTVVGGTLLVNTPGSLAIESVVTANSSGVLGGSGTIYGPVYMLADSSLVPGGYNTVGTLTLGNESATSLTLNGNNLRIDLSNVAGVSDQIAIAGANGRLSLNGRNFISLSFPYGVAPQGTYTLMTYAAKTGLGTIELMGAYPNATLTVGDSSVTLTLTAGIGSASSLTWKGNASTAWDGVPNWTNGSGSVTFTPGDGVYFDDTAMNYTVSSGNPVSPGTVLFNNSDNPYTVSAAIQGTGLFFKQGTNAVTLSGLSTYNPAFMDISVGSLILGAASQLNSGNYEGNINNNGVFNYTSSAPQTLSGIISGNGALTKYGSSTLTLSGPNTYYGTTTVNAGVLRIQNNKALGGAVFGTTVAAGATLEIAGSITTPAEPLDLSGTLSSPTGSNTYSGVVSLRTGSFVDVGLGSILVLTASTPDMGASPFSKTGAGTLRLTADPNHKGVCTVAGGTLELMGGGTTDADFIINAGATLRETTANLGTYRLTDNGTFDMRISDDFGGLDGSGLVTIGNTGSYTLNVGNGNAAGTFSGVIDNGSGTMSFTKAGTGNQILSGVNTYKGTTTVSGGALILSGAGQLGAGGYVGAISIASGCLLICDTSAQQMMSGVISGAGALRKTSTGTLMLTAVNTYNGATSISNGVLMGVTGGGCSNSVLTVQSSGSGATAVLSVRYTGGNTRWGCSNLTTSAGVSGGNAPKLQFVFTTAPSTSEAPLNVVANVALDATTTIDVVAPTNMVSGDYPLLVAGGTVPATTPAVTIGRGLSGSVSWGKSPYSAKTLVLTVSGTTAQPLKWNQTTAGTWDVNNTANKVWKDNAGTVTNYQQSIVGDHVIFDDTVTANTAVTLNTVVTPASLAFNNTSYNYTLSGSGRIAGDSALVKSGTNVVTLATTNNSYSGGTTLNLGTLKVASGGGISHSGADVVVGNSTAGTSNSLLKVESGASLQTRWLQAGTANGAVGAIHNQGDISIAGLNNTVCFALGSATGSYGYYRHDSTKRLIVPELAVAGSAGGDGVMDVLKGAITNSLYFLVTRGTTTQYAQVNVSGASLTLPDSNANVSMFNYSSSGQGVITVGDGGTLASLGNTTELDLIKTSTSGSAIGILNILSGGLVQATRVKATQGAGTALVNFNGGTLKAKYAQHDTGALLGGSSIDRATVYGNGATIDTDIYNINLSQALLAPTGNGVTSIPVTANGTGYIGRPMVYITGGGGTGATAVADYDPVAGTVTNITVTSPGYGYTSTPTVTLTGGGGTAPTLGTVTFGTVPQGGVTKTGGGMLTYYGANTYTGVTTIAAGTLRLGLGNVLPITAGVTVNNGSVYDLNGFTVTNSAVSMVNGSIVNGVLKVSTLNDVGDGVINAQIVSTTGLNKTGSGTLTLSTPQNYTGETAINAGTLKLVGRQPGLFEGRLSGAFDTTTANPRSSVLLSTRYANLFFAGTGSSFGIWPDNTTYIYTGYLWNNSPTNETWSFMRVFDDSTRIMLNGTNILYNTQSGATVVSNAVLRPGANSFELRLGQGGGAVGNNNTGWPNMGAGFDRLGRGAATYANFQRFDDPGDGSLLTTTNEITQANILPVVSEVKVAAGAKLDLGQTSQTLAGLTGSGLVTNGFLSVTGTVAPGGTNVIGTLTLATTNNLTGTLRADVSNDGTCDVLAVQGDVDLSGLALTVDVSGTLSNRSLEFTIMTCTGMRTGTFETRTLPSGWIVKYESNGDVKLVFGGATLIRIY